MKIPGSWYSIAPLPREKGRPRKSQPAYLRAYRSTGFAFGLTGFALNLQSIRREGAGCLTSHSPNRFYPSVACARTQCRSFRTLLDIFQCTMEAADGEFFFIIFICVVSLCGGRRVGAPPSTLERSRERERSKINRRPPAVLFLILKRALCIKWERTEYADDSTESCLSQFTKKVVDNTCRARALDFLHTANHCRPLKVHRLQTLSNGSEN
jgi:hypothetical protein